MTQPDPLTELLNNVSEDVRKANPQLSVATSSPILEANSRNMPTKPRLKPLATPLPESEADFQSWIIDYAHLKGYR